MERWTMVSLHVQLPYGRGIHFFNSTNKKVGQSRLSLILSSDLLAEYWMVKSLYLTTIILFPLKSLNQHFQFRIRRCAKMTFFLLFTTLSTNNEIFETFASIQFFSSGTIYDCG
jgi:hypothetical protein